MRRPEMTHPSGAIALAPDLPDGPWLVPVEDGWELDLGRAGAAPTVEDAQAVQTAVEAAAQNGGGTLRLWVRADDERALRAAQAAAMTKARELLQMRRPLPVDEPWDLTVRPFVVGQDEGAWLEVNNRAFAWHPEQGGMTLAELQAHEDADWFDPRGFLLHEANGQLRGFCWTKVHTSLDPPVGEIFVIAVDPSAHQRGLGRQLVLAGLAYLHSKGLTIGMLYTESDNEPALSLYRDLGFTVHSTDRAYTLRVSAR